MNIFRILTILGTCSIMSCITLGSVNNGVDESGHFHSPHERDKR